MYNIYYVSDRSTPYVIERASDGHLAASFLTKSELTRDFNHTFSSLTRNSDNYAARKKNHELIATISSLDTWTEELEASCPELFI